MAQSRRRNSGSPLSLVTKPQAQYASPQQVAEKLQDWSDEILECRTYGHTWSPHKAQHVKKWRYFYVVQLCHRCLTTRHMELSESGGEVFDSWYEYPDGYLSSGLGRIAGEARGQLRLATVQRTFQVETVIAKDTKRATRTPHGHTRRATGWVG